MSTYRTSGAVCCCCCLMALVASGCGGKPSAKPPAAGGGSAPAQAAAPSAPAPAAPVIPPPAAPLLPNPAPAQPPVISFAPPAAPVQPAAPVNPAAPVVQPSVAPAQPSVASNPNAVELKDAGKKDYGGGAILAPITVPIETYFSARDRIAAINIENFLKQYKAEHERGPRSHEEFMKEIVQANGIALPKLPEGHRYQYSPEDEKVYVVKPGK